jgi:hypothetical protein
MAQVSMSPRAIHDFLCAKAKKEGRVVTWDKRRVANEVSASAGGGRS